MSDKYANEPLLDIFIFETSQLLEQLEQAIISSEKESSYSENAIHEIYRIMHTIKGSSAMMRFQNISLLAHSMEDLFYFLRENKTAVVDHIELSDMVLDGVDFIKTELEKIKMNQEPDGNADLMISNLNEYLAVLKQENFTLIEKEVKEKRKIINQHYIDDNEVVDSNEFTYEAVVFF